MSNTPRDLDNLIGRLDRILSEIVYTAKYIPLDIFDRKTLEHHAEDMIGAGIRCLELLGSKVPQELLQRAASTKASPKLAPSHNPTSSPTPAEKDEMEGEILRESFKPPKVLSPRAGRHTTETPC